MTETHLYFQPTLFANNLRAIHRENEKKQKSSAWNLLFDRETISIVFAYECHQTAGISFDKRHSRQSVGRNTGTVSTRPMCKPSFVTTEYGSEPYVSV